jgi:RNA polymerase sigma-70 factor (ECF subfamily)
MPEDLAALLCDLRSGAARGRGLLDLSVRLRAMARRHLPGGSPLRFGLDSEDLAQEGLLQLVRHVDRFEGRSWPEFLAFARAVISQKASEAARRQSVRKAERGPSVASVDAATPDPTPSVDAMASEDRRRLRELVGTLPEIYRDAMSLRLEGCEIADVARSLDISEPAARKRLSRALQMMKERW